MTLSREDLEKLWEDAKANGRALDGCAGPHQFEDVTPQRKLGKQYVCALCRGRVDSQARHWYMRGLKHGGARA